jgi:Escherichia/Staphylococcus phage prohead protease
MTETLMPAEPRELRSAFVAHVDRVEVRESGEGSGEFTLTGHAAVFNRWSEDLATWAGSFRERIAKGAFGDVLKRKPDVRLLFNHDGLALARTKSGTLELSEDDEGLRVWARLAPTSTAMDLRMAMQRGDIDQMSFAFTVAEDEWHEDHETDEIERTIVRVGDLFDVSVVTFPAYPDTAAALREIRTAAAAGKITIPDEPVARAETDPAGTETVPGGAEAETDPPADEARDADAPAETDPAVGGTPLEQLKQRSKTALHAAGERHLLIKKEIARK